MRHRIILSMVLRAYIKTVINVITVNRSVTLLCVWQEVIYNNWARSVVLNYILSVCILKYTNFNYCICYRHTCLMHLTYKYFYIYIWVLYVYAGRQKKVYHCEYTKTVYSCIPYLLIILCIVIILYPYLRFTF